MSKTSRKTRTETEHLRGKIKELQSENKSLKKKIKALEKSEHLYQASASSVQDEEPDNDAEQLPQVSRKKPCDSCGKGFFEEFEIVGKVYGTCNICGHRERIK